MSKSRHIIIDPFSKAGIIVTILVLISNIALVFIDFEYLKDPTKFLTNVVGYKLLSIVIFSTLIVLKLFFKKAVNYIFLCFFTSIFITSLIGTLGGYLDILYNRLNPETNSIELNIWLALGTNLLWTIMFTYLFSKRKKIKQDETIYFNSKASYGKTLHFFYHGYIFMIFFLLMILSLFFVVKYNGFKAIFIMSIGIISLFQLLVSVGALISILRQSFSLFVFFACFVVYCILLYLVPTVVNLILNASTMPLNYKIAMIILQIICLTFIVIISIQTNKIYRKIKYKVHENEF